MFIPGLGNAIDVLALFGGMALVIRASAKSKLEQRKLDMMRGQETPLATAQATSESHAHVSRPGGRRDDAVLAEIKSLKQQISDAQSTGHQFDIAFDAALERMEQRIARLETKAALPAVAPSDEPNILRNGQ